MQQIVPAEWKAGKPKKDGVYLVIWRESRERDIANYTVDGGWNTHRDEGGILFDRYALSDDTFALWLDVEDPQEVTP